MAKSVEEKAVDGMIAAMDNRNFRETEFVRLLVERGGTKSFFALLGAFISYLAIFKRYGWYPYGVEEQAEACDELDRVLTKLYPFDPDYYSNV